MLKRALTNEGFTMIEIATVVLIIGMLVSITIPNFLSFAEQAKESAIKENMQVLQESLEMYAMDHDRTYPTQADEADFMVYCPRGQYPINPFTREPTVIVWDADPGAPGEISITALSGDGYRIRGFGAKSLLPRILEHAD